MYIRCVGWLFGKRIVFSRFPLPNLEQFQVGQNKLEVESLGCPGSMGCLTTGMLISSCPGFFFANVPALVFQLKCPDLCKTVLRCLIIIITPNSELYCGKYKRENPHSGDLLHCCPGTRSVRRWPISDNPQIRSWGNTRSHKQLYT